jgi:hypothetical protein
MNLFNLFVERQLTLHWTFITFEIQLIVNLKNRQSKHGQKNALPGQSFKLGKTTDNGKCRLLLRIYEEMF